ncbi:MAG TPA: hypothetical protein VL096_20495 [Pirellulaceae bacterium]|nr:hypothetical protein [Pirellulaceae bacterium]
MASTSPVFQLAPNIRSALAALRGRIRAYVWLEGLALAIIWLAVTFWLALALDYFPVLVWASEMPWAARATILGFVAIVFCYIVYRFILTRAFVPISDRSLAVLLERRHDRFHDSLVTSVELSGGHARIDSTSPEMLAHTHNVAAAQLSEVELAGILNYRPLWNKLALAMLLVASIITFWATNASAFEIAGERLYLLHDIPWPRSAAIEVVSLEVQRTAPGEATLTTSQVIAFEQQHVKVARGASALIRVRASADKRIPETCSIVYRTADGDRGTALMKKVGRVKDDYQYYMFDGKPFKGILSNLQFDVFGYDHRLRGFTIDVVDSPALIETTLACQFPAYMVDEANSQWLPRVESLTPATQLPMGTKLEIHCRANKPLQAVEVVNVETQAKQTIAIDTAQETFSYEVETLTGNLTLELTLLDTDGVLSERPQRLFIAAVKDEAPRVTARLAGIGSLVTPDVAIPVTGSMEDDYAIAKTWFDVMINDLPPQTFNFTLSGGKIEQTLDFRELRSQSADLTLKPAGKLTLGIVAQDKHNLEGGPHSGFGDRWELTVVTPDELLSSLEARELGLRRRFEQIITELTETRDELLRAATEAKNPPKDVDNSATAEPTQDADGASLSLRQLIAQRAVQQSQKSAQEILGVATSFADIRAELINNRVDTEERKVRLQEQIADPLTNIVSKQFPEFETRLEKMQATATDPTTSIAAVQATVDQANNILLELDVVLQRMLDLETYNELVELVRSLIDEQEKLMSETKKQQAADLFK